jgi:hypothetical protein
LSGSGEGFHAPVWIIKEKPGMDTPDAWQKKQTQQPMYKMGVTNIAFRARMLYN